MSVDYVLNSIKEYDMEHEAFTAHMFAAEGSEYIDITDKNGITHKVKAKELSDALSFIWYS